MTRAGHVLLWLAMALGMLALAAPAQAAAKKKPGEGRTFVGRVQGTNANIALKPGRVGTHAYVCDADQIFGFVRGNSGRRLRLANAAGYRVTAKVRNGRITGTVRFADGSKHRFTARPATGDAGLYELRKEVDGEAYLTRWVRLPDGRVRGKTTKATTGEAAGTEETVEATDGAGAESVPPSAEPAPEPLDYGGMTCGELRTEYDRLEAEKTRLKSKATKMPGSYRRSAINLIEREQLAILDSSTDREPPCNPPLF